MKKKAAIAALCIAAPMLAIGGGLPYTFRPGQVISAAEINANFAYLNAQISAPGSGAYVTKYGVLSPFGVGGWASQLVFTNTGSAPTLIDEAIGSARWAIECTNGQKMSFSSDTPRFLAPGCSLYATTPSAGSNQAPTYQVTYRQ